MIIKQTMFIINNKKKGVLDNFVYKNESSNKIILFN